MNPIRALLTFDGATNFFILWKPYRWVEDSRYIFNGSIVFRCSRKMRIFDQANSYFILSEARILTMHQMSDWSTNTEQNGYSLVFEVGWSDDVLNCDYSNKVAVRLFFRPVAMILSQLGQCQYQRWAFGGKGSLVTCPRGGARFSGLGYKKSPFFPLPPLRS
jgi:hypothetical protein